MKRQVLQFDLVTFDASKTEVTPQGFLKVMGRMTGVGVYPYRDPKNPSRIIRRLRSETEVFKPESIATLEDAPYTKRHPPEMVNAQNVSQYRKGHVAGPVVKEGAQYLTAPIIIEDADAIEDVKNGVKQLSCGYLATIDDTPGQWTNPLTGQVLDYDDQQCDIVYNHVAGVPTGRQGPDKSLLLDRKEFFFQDGLDFDMPKGDLHMIRTFVIDGQEFKVEIADDAQFNAIHKAIGKVHDMHDDVNKKLRDAKTMCDDFKEKMEKADTEKKESKDAADKAQALADSLKTENERLKKVHVDAADPKNLLKLATNRALKVAVLNQMTDGKKIAMEDAMEQTDAELMKLVIVADASLDIPAGKEHDAEVKKFSETLKDKSEVYLQGLYDAIERREKKTLSASLELGTFIIDSRELKGRKDKQQDGLNPNLRTTGTSAAKSKDEGEIGNKPEPTGIITKGVTGGHAKDDDKAYRDKQEGAWKDYKGAKSKDTKEAKVR